MVMSPVSYTLTVQGNKALKNRIWFYPTPLTHPSRLNGYFIARICDLIGQKSIGLAFYEFLSASNKISQDKDSRNVMYWMFMNWTQLNAVFYKPEIAS